MARLYDPISGRILLGGEDIRNIHLKSLRQAVCYVPRDPVLFDGSILSNLLFVRPSASQKELEEAMEIAGLSALVSLLPKGLLERIGPDGCQLSGGERQRLALARAMLQRPRVLILDEATSCLDGSTEALILRNLLNSLATSTLILVSHRQATFLRFRRLLILSAGRVIEDRSRGPLLEVGFGHSSQKLPPTGGCESSMHANNEAPCDNCERTYRVLS